VAIAGYEVLTDAGGVKPGETVRVDGKPFVIVGTLEHKMQMEHGEGFGGGWNSRLLIPERLYNLEFNINRRPSQIVAKIRPPPEYGGLLRDYVVGSRELMRKILMERREHETFKFGGVSESNESEQTVLMAIKALTLLTTVFSMIVGGINIMNIMLVTVAERTREIGIRRALGATRADILRQFLAETLAVTAIGAGVGILGAIALLAIASRLLTEHVAPWPFYVDAPSVIGAFTGSVAISLVFGLLPAGRAARLAPVEALRQE
jgi:putative ABC transport system permease protein